MAVWCNHQCLTRHTANVQAGTSSRPQAERGTLPPPLPFSQVLQLILSHLATELSLRSPSSHRVLAHGPTQPGLQKAQPGSHLLLSGLSTRAGFLIQRHPGSLSLCGDNLRLTPQAEDNHSALTVPSCVGGQVFWEPYQGSGGTQKALPGLGNRERALIHPRWNYGQQVWE